MTTTDPSLRYIDSDGHILEPPTGMLDFAPAAYRDRIWHVETDAEGVEWSVWNGERTRSGGLAGHGRLLRRDGRPGPQPARSPTARPARRAGPPMLRLKDLDTDGIELSVLYPTMMLGLQSLDGRRVRPGAGPGVQRLVRRPPAGAARAGSSAPGLSRRCTIPTTCRQWWTRSGTWPSCRGWCRCSCGPTRRSSGATSTTPSTTRSGPRCRTRGCRWRSIPSWLRTCPGPATGLKLARVHNPDGTYVSLRGVRSRRVRTAVRTMLPNIYFTQAIANPVDVMSAICYHHLRRRGRAVPRGQVHVPRGQRRLAGALAGAARPPRPQVQLGRSVAEDAALGVLPPPVLDQLRPRRVDARPSPPTRRCAERTGSSGRRTTRIPTPSSPA